MYRIIITKKKTKKNVRCPLST